MRTCRGGDEHNLIFLHARSLTFPAFAELAEEIGALWQSQELPVAEVIASLAGRWSAAEVEAAAWKLVASATARGRLAVDLGKVLLSEAIPIRLLDPAVPPLLPEPLPDQLPLAAAADAANAGSEQVADDVALDQRAARIARWEEVQRRHAVGESLRSIARTMGMNRHTVRRLVAEERLPQNHIGHPRPGGLTSPTLEPYVSHLQDRWRAGCHIVAQLYREIALRGYQGSYSLLQQALAAWRPPRPAPKERMHTRQLSIRWLCLRPPEDLKPD
jgi:hypothetical protein